MLADKQLKNLTHILAGFMPQKMLGNSLASFSRFSFIYRPSLYSIATGYSISTDSAIAIYWPSEFEGSNEPCTNDMNQQVKTNTALTLLTTKMGGHYQRPS
mgnify:CR=1 FL=1